MLIRRGPPAPGVLPALEAAVEAGEIHFDLLLAADSMAREISRMTGQPIDVELERDWVALLVERGDRELEVALSFDRSKKWRLFFSAIDSDVRAGVILRESGLVDLVCWLMGAAWEERHLDVGRARHARRSSDRIL